jgi:hypothetical protein
MVPRDRGINGHPSGLRRRFRSWAVPGGVGMSVILQGPTAGRGHRTPRSPACPLFRLATPLRVNTTFRKYETLIPMPLLTRRFQENRELLMPA